MLYIKQYLRYIYNIKTISFGWGFAALANAPYGGWLPAAVAEGDSRKNNSTRKKNKLLDPAAAVSCCGGGFAAARQSPCGGGEPSPLLPDQHNHQHNQHIDGFCRRRWDGFQPLPPIGDSHKKQQHKDKLLESAVAAAGSCCGGGFAPLAAGHSGEESRHQHNHQHIGGFCRRRGMASSRCRR